MDDCSSEARSPFTPSSPLASCCGYAAILASPRQKIKILLLHTVEATRAPIKRRAFGSAMFGPVYRENRTRVQYEVAIFLT